MPRDITVPPCCQICARTAPPLADFQPHWHCPQCGISTNDLRANLLNPVQGEEPTHNLWRPAFGLDVGVLPLLAANGIAFAIALFQDWHVQSLLLVYWCQSLL